MPFHGRSRPSPADQKQDKTSKRVLGSVFALDHLSKVTPSDTHVPCPWASDEPQTAGHTRAGKRPQGKGRSHPRPTPPTGRITFPETERLTVHFWRRHRVGRREALVFGGLLV